MKIARQTFHGPNRLTVVAGEVFADDDEVVQRWPDKFADPEEVAEGRRPRSHSFGTVEAATARPGELSDARALEPRGSATDTDDESTADEPEAATAKRGPGRPRKNQG